MNVSEHMRLITDYLQLFQLLCINILLLFCICVLFVLVTEHGKLVLLRSQDSEDGPGEEARVEVETSGCSAQSAAGETATSAAQVPILTIPEPSKKFKRAQQQQPAVQLMHKARL